MYVGFVFLCTTKSLEDCLRSKLFACSGETARAAREIATDSIVFLLNTDSNVLVGPFTATSSTRTGLEPGTWTEAIDTHSFSGNIKVEWEELHEIRDAQDSFPFLKDIKTCRLTHLQIQDLLDALKKAPLSSFAQRSVRKHK
jgi:hypothetical protein